MMMTRKEPPSLLLLMLASAAAKGAELRSSLRSHHHRSLSFNAAITEDQYQQCLMDMLSSDENGDYELNAQEFIRFVTLNSASVYDSSSSVDNNSTNSTSATTWGYSFGQQSLDQLPINFAMLFYSQACLCSYDGEEGGDAAADSTCCSGDKAHVDIYAGPKYDGSITEKQDIYVREFCTESYHAYSLATFAPTNAPAPPTSSPMSTEVATPVPSPTTTDSGGNETAVVAPTGMPSLSATSPSSSSTGTASPSTTLPPSTSPPISSSSSTTILPVAIKYGISSDCGVTAYDLMNNIGGITIKDGLKVATETIVVDILNSTLPTTSETRSGSGGGGFEFSVSNVATKTAMVGEGTTKDDEHDELLPHLIRYYDLLPAGGGTAARSSGSASNKSNMGQEEEVSYIPLNDLRPKRQRHLSFSSDHTRRNLVYYTTNNVEITDATDTNNDQACPPGQTCMVVSSVIQVILEPGDDQEVVTKAIQDGLQESYLNGSFFQAIPEETVLCPPDNVPSVSLTASPSQPSAGSYGGSSTPSSSPSSSGDVSSSSLSPSSMVGSTISNASAAPSPVPSAPLNTTGGNGNETLVSPTAMPSTFSMGGTAEPSMSITAPNSSPSSMTGGNATVKVTINYDIENQCGLDAVKVMNEEGNTLKSGLIAATTAATIDTLNATFPREEVFKRHMRGLKKFSDDKHRDLAYVEGVYNNPAVNRVYYTDEHPVVIDRILDIETGCDPGTNCLLIISTITVILETGDDESVVEKAVTDGMNESFKDGSFNSLIPSDTIICPVRSGVKVIVHESRRLRATKKVKVF